MWCSKGEPSDERSCAAKQAFPPGKDPTYEKPDGADVVVGMFGLAFHTCIGMPEHSRGSGFETPDLRAFTPDPSTFSGYKFRNLWLSSGHFPLDSLMARTLATTLLLLLPHFCPWDVSRVKVWGSGG